MGNEPLDTLGESQQLLMLFLLIFTLDIHDTLTALLPLCCRSSSTGHNSSILLLVCMEMCLLESLASSYCEELLSL